MKYFLKLKGLQDQHNSRRSLPMCYCIHKCSCVALQIAQEYIHEDQDIQFLKGFNDDFLLPKLRFYLWIICHPSIVFTPL